MASRYMKSWKQSLTSIHKGILNFMSLRLYVHDTNERRISSVVIVGSGCECIWKLIVKVESLPAVVLNQLHLAAF